MVNRKTDDIENETPDPEAFNRFKDFTRRILSVPKTAIQDTERNADKIDKANSPSTN